MYLVPHLGTVLLVDLRAEQIELTYRKIMAETLTSPRPISVTTLRRIHSTLISALSTAVRRGMIDRNPASTVELPRPNPRKATAWTVEELSAFLKGIETDPLYLMFLILGLRGLRRGEAVALRWANVDLDEQTLRIEESATVVSGRTILGPPKSAAGRRVISIDTGTADLLRAHRAAQQKARDLIGSPIKAILEAHEESQGIVGVQVPEQLMDVPVLCRSSYKALPTATRFGPLTWLRGAACQGGSKRAIPQKLPSFWGTSGNSGDVARSWISNP